MYSSFPMKSMCYVASCDYPLLSSWWLLSLLRILSFQMLLTVLFWGRFLVWWDCFGWFGPLLWSGEILFPWLVWIRLVGNLFIRLAPHFQFFVRRCVLFLFCLWIGSVVTASWLVFRSDGKLISAGGYRFFALAGLLSDFADMFFPPRHLLTYQQSPSRFRCPLLLLLQITQAFPWL